MRISRLSEALSGETPGKTIVFRPNSDTDLSGLVGADTVIQTGFKPDFDLWRARGFACVAEPGDAQFDSAVLIAPRAKALARGLLQLALSVTNGGPVYVDGAKTDGIDSLWKDARKQGEVSGVITRNHGRCFTLVANPEAFADWALKAPAPTANGFVTAPGVFSADGIDPGSAQLAGALPELKGRVLDLGAGWGFLAATALSANPDISELHLIEAEHDALACARLNVTDPRAVFHWNDATKFKHPAPFDHVITNPPFHTGRAGDPALGAAFLATAAACLRPSGKLWLVANRHLPYEQPLERLFRNVSELGGNTSFKVLHANGPKKRTR